MNWFSFSRAALTNSCRLRKSSSVLLMVIARSLDPWQFCATRPSATRPATKVWAPKVWRTHDRPASAYRHDHGPARRRPDLVGGGTGIVLGRHPRPGGAALDPGHRRSAVLGHAGAGRLPDHAAE